MTTPPPAKKVSSSTRQKLLRAAAVVFARDGLEGATTRAIAREAGVNEVTLFRHFKSKDRLLSAVVGENFGPGTSKQDPQIPPLTGDLQADLTELAATFDRLLTSNLPLVRTMVGEIQRYQEHERQVFHGIFQPLKTALRARLKLAHAAGQLRPDSDLEILGDLFVSMVFMGVLRRHLPHVRRPYSNAAYLENLVKTILHGSLAPGNT
jgi:AcrR family transcriptional regulator